MADNQQTPQQITAIANIQNWLKNSQYPGTNTGIASGPQSDYNPTLLNPSLLQQETPTLFGGAQVGPAVNAQAAQLAPISTIDPQLVQSIAQGYSPDLSANAQIQQIIQGFFPEQTQQQGQLNQQLAASGLSGGPAIAAQQNFNTRMTQALAPSIASAIAASQSNLMNQGQYDTTQLMNALTNNQSAINAGNTTQSGYQQQAILANALAQNNNQILNTQNAQQAGISNQDAINNVNTANVGAYNQTLAANISALNSGQSALNQALQNQWGDQFAAYNAINDAGLNTQNNITANAANNFGTSPDIGSAFSSLGSGFSSLYQPKQQQAATVSGATK